MSGLMFFNVIANIVIFSGLGVLAWSTALRNRTEPIRSLAWALSLGCWAFVLGSAIDLALLAVRPGWLSGAADGFVVETWHVGQSLAITGLGMTTTLMIRRVDLGLQAADRMVLRDAQSNR